MGTKMLKKSLLGTAVGALAIAGLGVGTAGAAKPDDVPRGQVEQGPEHARSICSFSGLNDDPGEEGPGGGQVQSYGQLVKQGLKPVLDADGHSPGALCNPVKGIDMHGGG